MCIAGQSFRATSISLQFLVESISSRSSHSVVVVVDVFEFAT